MFRFEKLIVWQTAVELADNIYEATNHFPVDERFGLTSQLRRAAVSVSANIAEGSGRGTNPDFARFVEIAYGSVMEVVSEMVITRRRGWVSESGFDAVYRDADELARMLSGLRTSLKTETK
ncbi:MAG: four helix bundle protein [Planctomycetaceae bacterium]